eukprot:3187555-Alexandrium_andersonii.AAC.1
MSASLVGSEMCIRDRYRSKCAAEPVGGTESEQLCCGTRRRDRAGATSCGCLLYTSDAADDM